MKKFTGVFQLPDGTKVNCELTDTTKTMVVLNLPDGTLLYCDKDDLSLEPGVRQAFVFAGNEYEIERMRQVLDRNPDGSRKPTSEQLLDLMLAVAPANDPMAALAMVARMRNIGEPHDTRTTGGIILGTAAKLIEEADRLVVLKMRHIGTVPNVDKTAMLGAIGSHLTAVVTPTTGS